MLLRTHFLNGAAAARLARIRTPGEGFESGVESAAAIAAGKTRRDAALNTSLIHTLVFIPIPCPNTPQADEIVRKADRELTREKPKRRCHSTRKHTLQSCAET